MLLLPLRAHRSSHFPYYRRTYPALDSKCRRAIHRFDRANSVTICAVFLTKPPEAHLGITTLALDHPERMLNLGLNLNLNLGLLDLTHRFV